MKEINVLKTNETTPNSWHNAKVSGVMPTIRSMSKGDIILFPNEWREAVRTATSIMRKNGNNIFGHTKYIDGKKYLEVRMYQPTLITETRWYRGDETPEPEKMRFKDGTLFLVVPNKKTTFDSPAYICFWDKEEKEPWGVMNTQGQNKGLRIATDEVEKWCVLDDLIDS